MLQEKVAAIVMKLFRIRAENYYGVSKFLATFCNNTENAERSGQQQLSSAILQRSRPYPFTEQGRFQGGMGERPQ